ncbi:hypothetical protein XENOCAPTIV_002140, partial [Xenoophorus captivus]
MLNVNPGLSESDSFSWLDICASHYFPLTLQTVESRIVPNSDGGLGLLALPIRALREQEAERNKYTTVFFILQRHQQVVEESQRLTELLVSSVNDVFAESENPEDQENEDPEDAEGRASRLWVDRFSPRHYTELLSDDVRDL